MPFVNIYAQLHLHEAEKAEMGLSDDDSRLASRVHVLTYSPNLLRMEQPCTLEQIDAYSFRVSIEDRPYFSGALGRFLMEGLRGGGRFQQGEVIAHPQFEVEITRAGQDGVHELVFRFREPLASPKHCFYITTNQSSAARVMFWKNGDRDRVMKLDQPVDSVALRERRDALFGIREIASKVIQTDLYLTGPPFPSPQ